jgi:hypothetical protein
MQGVSETSIKVENELYQEVCSQDFLGFSFAGRGYASQIKDAVAKTEVSNTKVNLSEKRRKLFLISIMRFIRSLFVIV